MKLGVVLMTALLPTKGHINLIQFASVFMNPDPVVVIVSTLPEEPISGYIRANQIERAVYNTRFCSNVHIVHVDRDVPQNPSEHPEFWKYWTNLINEHQYPATKLLLSDLNEICLFASEKYGYPMAEAIRKKNPNARFIPYDMNREITPTKSTDVRKDIIGRFDDIIPEMKLYMPISFTFFGAESCGKTTMAKAMSKEMNGRYVPEWARLYLEEKGPELNKQVMQDIVNGEYAALINASYVYLDKPYIFRDTDLVSTLGYYQILGMKEPNDLLPKIYTTYPDLYIVMNSKIPFEPDILRYGIDKRESTDQYWIGILNELERPYYYVQSTDFEEQKKEIREEIERVTHKLHRKVSEYERR